MRRSPTDAAKGAEAWALQNHNEPEFHAPTIAVVIPAYNQATFLREAIESALSQTVAPTEVIVVDDGSTDETAAVAGEFGARISYVRQSNQGLSAARNAGIAAASSDLVQLLDADDALHPRALELAREAARCFPTAGAFAGGWDEVDIAGRAFARVAAPPMTIDMFHAFFDVARVGPASRYCLRRSALATVGLFDTRLGACEDWDMWLRMAAAGLEFVALPEATLRYRNYATSMSKRPSLMWRSGITVLDRAASVHSDCLECRAAHRAGTKAFRSWCYISMVAPRIRDAYEQRRYAGVVREIAVALVRDPGGFPLMLRTLWSRRPLHRQCPGMR